MWKRLGNMEKVSNMIQYDPIWSNTRAIGVPQLPLIHPTAMVSTEIPPGNHRGARDQMVPIAEMMQCWASTYRKVHCPASGGGLTSEGMGLGKICGKPMIFQWNIRFSGHFRFQVLMEPLMVGKWGSRELWVVIIPYVNKLVSSPFHNQSSVLRYFNGSNSIVVSLVNEHVANYDPEVCW